MYALKTARNLAKFSFYRLVKFTFWRDSESILRLKTAKIY